MVAPALSPQCVQALFSFVGYGPENPTFVFIGPEEGSEGLMANLEIRCQAFPSSRHDRVQACRDFASGYIARGLQSEARRYLDALTPGAEPTWTFAARLVAALRKPATTWQAEYQSLGTHGGDTLLAELFPLPKSGMGTWPAPYITLFGYPDQEQFYDQVWPRAAIPGTGVSQRADLLASTLASIPLSRSCTVIGYGRGGRRAEFWERFDREIDRTRGATGATGAAGARR